jgi:hypothetical protein
MGLVEAVCLYVLMGQDFAGKLVSILGLAVVAAIGNAMMRIARSVGAPIAVEQPPAAV